jgi:hypothetical protein
MSEGRGLRMSEGTAGNRGLQGDVEWSRSRRVGRGSQRAAHLVNSDVEVCVHVALLPFEVFILVFVHLEMGNISR